MENKMPQLSKSTESVTMDFYFVNFHFFFALLGVVRLVDSIRFHGTAHNTTTTTAPMDDVWLIITLSKRPHRSATKKLNAFFLLVDQSSSNQMRWQVKRCYWIAHILYALLARWFQSNHVWESVRFVARELDYIRKHCDGDKDIKINHKLSIFCVFLEYSADVLYYMRWRFVVWFIRTHQKQTLIIFAFISI